MAGKFLVAKDGTVVLPVCPALDCGAVNVRTSTPKRKVAGNRPTYRKTCWRCRRSLVEKVRSR